MELTRAYSVFLVKNFDEDQRIIEGIATTPTTDRQGDVVEPEGARVSLPLPLLWQHDALAPIGHVIEARISAAGIMIKAQLAKISEPGKLKDRLDEAWQSLKAGLVRGLSIGFKPLGDPVPIRETGGFRWLEWDWMELSCVTLAANADASITSIKSADQQALLAASPASRSRPIVQQTVAELDHAFNAPDSEMHLDDYHTKRAEILARNYHQAAAAPVVATPAPATKLDEHTTVTRGFFHSVLGPVMQSIGRLMKEQDAKLRGDLEKRIEALESKAAALRYCGTWRAGESYREGNFATYDGSMFHANCETSSRPGTDSTWTLAVKHGRDLR